MFFAITIEDLKGFIKKYHAIISDSLEKYVFVILFLVLFMMFFYIKRNNYVISIISLLS